MRASVVRRSGVFAVVAALAAACSSGTPTGESGAASAGPSASSSPSTPPPDPTVGECRRIPFASAAKPEDQTAPVDCRSPHTAQTVKVGDLERLGGTPLDGAISGSLRDRVARACSTRLLRSAGGDRTRQRLSRLEVVWFVPTPQAVRTGARWFRCDVVGVAAEGRLIRLPRTVAKVLDADDALERFGTCGTAAPGKRGFRRVVCRRTHTWQAVDVVDIDRRARYLGRRATAAGDASCQDLASARSGGALRYSWSFEWPTRAQWDGGQRYGYCWVPG